MKQFAVYSLLVVMFVLAGCPQITRQSVDEGSYDVPSWLPGKWWEMDKEGKKKNGYLIEKGAKKGMLRSYEIDSAGNTKPSTARKIVMSSISGKIYLSAYDPGDDMTEEGYYLFEFRKVSNSEFVLAGVKEHKISYDASPDEIKAFLEKNKDDFGLFDPAEIFRYKKQ